MFRRCLKYRSNVVCALLLVIIRITIFEQFKTNKHRRAIFFFITTKPSFKRKTRMIFQSDIQTTICTTTPRSFSPLEPQLFTSCNWYGHLQIFPFVFFRFNVVCKSNIVIIACESAISPSTKEFGFFE